MTAGKSGRGKKKSPKALRTVETLWGALRPVCVFVVSLCLVAGALYTGFQFVYSHYIGPVDTSGALLQDDPTYRVVTIKSGSTVSAIGRQLVQEGIIRSKAVFQYTADFLSKGPKLQAGSFLLSPKMSIMQIIDTLSTMQESRKTMMITTIEGSTVEQMAQSLVEQGALEDSARFLALCKTGEAFCDEYDFIASAMETASPQRTYLLEGYLFPDTYEIYVGASEETIIRKMLDRMKEMLALANAHLDDEDAMTIDEVVTLASMIEKEAKRSDFDKVSAVFHNRLSQGMKLQSDVTVHYITGRRNMVLTAQELAIDSPYNTYVTQGLPAGPVCCPSQYALEAALYPNETYLDSGMLYFCAADPESGELVFAKTLAEHEANVAKYRDLWAAYDAQTGQ